MPSDLDGVALVRALAPLARTLVHDDNSRAFQILSAALPGLSVEGYPSGSCVWTWRIPNKWRLIEAQLNDAMTGELLWDGMCHPLATVNYSLSFEGIVDRETMERHLHSAPQRPGAIPFVFRFYNRDWGFCLPESRRRDVLKHERFRVKLIAEEVPDRLLAGVYLLPGDHEEEILIVSNICHPGIANDSITGVAAAVDLAGHLGTRTHRKYTYRFLFLPETIGSVAYLAHHPEVIARARGAFFSEMLGTDNSLCLQRSRHGQTYWDRVAEQTLRDTAVPFRTTAFLHSASNDEKILDAPGVNIPTISITRYPYPEYHTSDDNADLIDRRLLDESFACIRALFDRIEADYIPIYLSHGPVCLSEHGLYPDWYRDPSQKPAWDGFLKVMYALDDLRSCEELAADLDLPVQVVRHWTDAFREKGFVRAEPHVAAKV